MSGAVPPFFCVDCRSRCQDMISEERGIRRNGTLRLAIMRDQSLDDTRTERWLETRDDIVRQNRATPQQPWMDTSGDDLVPAISQKTKRVRNCLICKLSPREVAIRLRDETGQYDMMSICTICAKLASNGTYPVNVNVGDNPDTLLAPFTLTQCPGCTAQVIQSDPIVPCHSCVDDAISAAEKLVGDAAFAELADLLEVNPTGSCRRCDPQSCEEPYNCPSCRSDYRAMPDSRFPVFSNRGNAGTCCVCRAVNAAIVAIEDGERNHHGNLICTTCARIACHHPLKHRRTGKTVKLALCEGCGVHRNSLNDGLCEDCGHRMSALQNSLTELCDYLWLFLETPKDETTPEPPASVAKWLRPDSTTRRNDAPANGRLNQHLSREICREYTTQLREIPELAIRFSVPATTVRNVLRGKTWAKQTADVRPEVMRSEPYRKRQQTERPPTITVSRLKGELGWTDELIRQHLGDEDVRLRNPHYSTSAPMRLYRLDRVETVTEATPSLQKKLMANLGRRKASQIASNRSG